MVTSSIINQAVGFGLAARSLYRRHGPRIREDHLGVGQRKRDQLLLDLLDGHLRHRDPSLMQIRTEYRDNPVRTPITPWAHRAMDGPYWSATVFDPPCPRPVQGKGYPVWFLDHRGRTLVLASPEEIAHVIDILSRKILPRARELGQPYLAVNSHWLSRLHASFKPWKVRQELVKRLRNLPLP